MRACSGRLAAASGGRRACREGRAADLRARDAQASSCSGFLKDETGSTGEATLRVRDDHFSKRSSVAGPARTRAPCVSRSRGPLPATASGRGAWENTRRAASSGCHARTAAANRAGGTAGALRAMHRVAHARRRRTVRVRQGIVRAPSKDIVSQLPLYYRRHTRTCLGLASRFLRRGTTCPSTFATASTSSRWPRRARGARLVGAGRRNHVEDERGARGGVDAPAPPGAPKAHNTKTYAVHAI